MDSGRFCPPFGIPCWDFIVIEKPFKFPNPKLENQKYFERTKTTQQTKTLTQRPKGPQRVPKVEHHKQLEKPQTHKTKQKQLSDPTGSPNWNKNKYREQHKNTKYDYQTQGDPQTGKPKKLEKTKNKTVSGFFKGFLSFL